MTPLIRATERGSLERTRLDALRMQIENEKVVCKFQPNLVSIGVEELITVHIVEMGDIKVEPEVGV